MNAKRNSKNIEQWWSDCDHVDVALARRNSNQNRNKANPSNATLARKNHRLAITEVAASEMASKFQPTQAKYKLIGPLLKNIHEPTFGQPWPM